MPSVTAHTGHVDDVRPLHRGAVQALYSLYVGEVVAAEPAARTLSGDTLQIGLLCSGLVLVGVSREELGLA